ncbi:peroxisome assembly protein [Leishmania donovani]|uniref:Peroxisomal ATPase PEX6 n=1 Tax=Leishmania donovani TaxID=5661 RepID=A0A504WYE5_LEIDO|nr:ATPase associated with various cellular activities (AAA) family protein [Leishmania donovani]CAJ1987593.1 peroxisome assembly protein [Leishmania donovani]VDZ43481.1 peroxisome_assembly_protein_putative/GeneDB:LmjF.16.0060 [Leishmania donovani]
MTPSAAYLPMTRCIFRALTDEGYKAVMGKPPGTYSLQSEIAQNHASLHLHQIVDGTDAYPSLRVVDLLPSTHCSLSADTAVTMVVLPPTPIVGDRADRDVAREDHHDDAPAACVAVRLDNSLRGSTALATPHTLENLLLEDEAIVKVSGCCHNCVFVVNELGSTPTGSSSGAMMTVGPELFRNVRAAFYSHPSQMLMSSAQSVDYSNTVLCLPVDAFQPVEDDSGELLHRSAAAQTHALTKIVFCPAVNDATLTELYGLHYPDLCALFGAASAVAWEGRLVSTGDVLYLEKDTLHAAAQRLEGVDVLESVSRVLSHKVRKWNETWVDENASCRHLLALRVTRLERSGTPVPFGVLRNCGGEADTVEVALVHQRNSHVWEHTPVWAPSPAYGLADVQVYARLCRELRRVVTPSLECDVHTFVVHGVKENLPREFVECAVAAFGLPCLLASAEAMEEAELETLTRTFLGELCGATTVLIVHNAHTIADLCPHFLSVLDELSSGVRATVGGGPPPGPRILFLLCESIDAVPPMIAARATNADGVLECGNPSEEDRAAFIAPLLQWSCAQHRVHASVLLSPKTLAGWAVGLTYADILSLVEACVRDAAQCARCTGEALAVVSDVSCEPVVQSYLKSHGYSMVSTKLQPVRWGDVGGMEEAKRELREMIQLPILHPEVFEKGMKKRTGVLFYGPPGCGKTLLAKAVATEMSMNFISVKGPELINQYVGESERNIRLLFQRARDNSPCIVFFDEIDALAPARGAKGDAGGVMDRIVSQLLVEVDGVGQKRSDGTASGDVFIIGATNRPDLLDPALLRPGRFDRLCYLGIPSTREEQLFALKALTRKFDMSADVDLSAVLEPLDFVYTGADFFALCSDAMMFAVEDALEELQQQITTHALAETGAANTPDSALPPATAAAEEERKPITVCMQHFLRARAQLKPSVTKADLQKYEALKQTFDKSTKG